MTYTANQLISGAFYTAGIVSREFSTVDGTQLNDGLSFLNDIILEKRVDNAMIPYETTYKFKALSGVEKYWIPDLVQIDTLVFYLNKVRFSMSYSKRNDYFGSGRVEGVNSLPYSWYFERQTNGGNLYIYFSPDRNYEMEIHGTFALSSVALNQDLEQTQPSVNLGTITLNGILNSFSVMLPPQLVAGALVVNGIDLNGSYETIGALSNYINSGVVPGIQATVVNNQLILTSISEPPTPISIQTAGLPPEGTRSKGDVKAYTESSLLSFYSFGTLSTLTSTVNGTLSLQAGYTLQANDRVLVKNQSIEFENGIYSVSDPGSVTTPWLLERVSNSAAPDQIRVGDYVRFINSLTTFPTQFFIQTEIVSDIFSSINFDPFNIFTFSDFSLIDQPNYNLYNAIGFDRFYITYLRYALAERICCEYNYEASANLKAQLSKYEAWINKQSRLIDLRMKKVSTLNKRGGYSWAYVNLGRGFMPY